ncbi:MAG: hypothetical protein K6G31_04475 [Paludibacteraceae bacterium]|nr:hypothetical protein [Paludibacteraceae bacterium]
MEQARYRIALSNIVSEIDRRCFDITHPIPDNGAEVVDKMETMKRIVEKAHNAVLNLETGIGTVGDLEDVMDFINKERIREYEKERQRKETKQDD